MDLFLDTSTQHENLIRYSYDFNTQGNILVSKQFKY